MKQKNKVKTIVFQISAILILLSAALYNFFPETVKYTMLIGVSGFAAVTFTTPYPGNSTRGKRLHNFQLFAVILMAVSAYLMFIDRKEWVVLLLIAALFTLYSTIVTTRAYKQELEENKKENK